MRSNYTGYGQRIFDILNVILWKDPGGEFGSTKLSFVPPEMREKAIGG